VSARQIIFPRPMDGQKPSKLLETVRYRRGGPNTMHLSFGEQRVFIKPGDRSDGLERHGS